MGEFLNFTNLRGHYGFVDLDQSSFGHRVPIVLQEIVNAEVEFRWGIVHKLEDDIHRSRAHGVETLAPLFVVTSIIQMNYNAPCWAEVIHRKLKYATKPLDEPLRVRGPLPLMPRSANITGSHKSSPIHGCPAENRRTRCHSGDGRAAAAATATATPATTSPSTSASTATPASTSTSGGTDRRPKERRRATEEWRSTRERRRATRKRADRCSSWRRDRLPPPEPRDNC